MRRWALLLPLLTACESEAAPPPATPVRAVNFEELAGWEFAIPANVPATVKAYDGQKIEITGFIYPVKNPRNVREFILMKDRGTCCYGPQTQWTHFIEVKIPESYEAINYTTEPVTVIGTLRVVPKEFDGMPDGLYFMEAEAHRK